MKAYLVITLFQVLATFTFAATFISPKRSCILRHDGTNDCNSFSILLTSTRAESPCHRRDIACWNKMVLKYTNKVRVKYNVSKLILGSKSQLKNANKHADYLSKKGDLVHQTMGEATKKVKCSHWVGGENLSFLYEDGDIARACVNEWVNSPPHFQNLIRDWFEEVVTGFHFDKDGRVYCVQAFSLYRVAGTFGSVNDRKCEPVA